MVEKLRKNKLILIILYRIFGIYFNIKLFNLYNINIFNIKLLFIKIQLNINNLKYKLWELGIRTKSIYIKYI